MYAIGFGSAGDIGWREQKKKKKSIVFTIEDVQLFGVVIR